MAFILRRSEIKTPWHLRVLYVSTFFLRTAFGALLLLLSAYVGGDASTRLLAIAIIAVPYPLAEMLTANYFGVRSDKVGRKRVIVFGTSLAAVTVALYSLSNNVWYLMAMHGIHGIGAAATVAPAIAMIADKAHGSDRGRQMGWFDYSTFLGYIVGAVIGGFLVDYFNVQIGFVLIAGMLALSAMILQISVKQEIPANKAEGRSGISALRKVFQSREIRMMFPIWLIVATLLGLALTYLPIILLSQNVTGTTIGILFAGAGVLFGLLQPFWGKVSDTFGRIPVMTYGVLSMFGVIIIITFFQGSIYYTDSFGTHVDWLVVAILAILGLGIGAFVPSALAFMADSSDSKSYGATMGLYSFALGFGAFIAESSGLIIILLTGKEDATIWLLYFAAVLICLAVVLTIMLLISSRLGRRHSKAS